MAAVPSGSEGPACGEASPDVAAKQSCSLGRRLEGGRLSDLELGSEVRNHVVPLNVRTGTPVGEQGQEKGGNLELGTGQLPCHQTWGTELASARGKDPASGQVCPGVLGTWERANR